ncbi:helix-turn-helix domain-containing protein [Neptunomonas antarctica]|uniref:Transcriptional regulator, AraC family n=1 Tax=Neptunomonas antarctica TaxID=619304 RepID=A0A1N7N8C0_9GAMM|nr:AraC family transcriptional regulator [Neptunomonas antarctica]SIS94590.1 transcriptional regulator, AraC family [Neptunomonas antarctica]
MDQKTAQYRSQGKRLDSTLFFEKSRLLPGIELRCAQSSTACYGTHSHDEYSFGVIDQGVATYYNQKSKYCIGAGDTVMINPADAHSCNAQEEDWSYRMLFVDPQWVKRLQHDLACDQASDYIPFRMSYSSKQQSFSDFDLLFNCLLSGESPLQAESLLLEYLGSSLAVKQSNSIKSDSVSVRRVQELIQDQLGENLTLDEFSKQAGISRFHLIRSFKQVHGQAPHAFQLDARIKKAKLLLQQGHSLVEISGVLGFADQSHFQRHFKRRIAITPKQYQAFFI